MGRKYPSSALRRELEAFGVPRDEHDLVSLSVRFGFTPQPYQQLDIDIVAGLLISALRRRARNPQLFPPQRQVPRGRLH